MHHCAEKRCGPEGKVVDLPVHFVSTLALVEVSRCSKRWSEGWVMTEITRLCVQADKMGLLRRVSGLSLSDRVRSSVIREELGVEPLLLRVERAS